MTEPSDCAFCSIIRGEEPADVVLDQRDVLAFAPLEPAAKGHTLVVPKIHVADFREAGTAVLTSLCESARLVALAVERVLLPEGFNVITSAGEAASQTIFHLHVHVVPRWRGDQIGDIWPPTTPHLEATQEDVASALRQAVDDVVKELTQEKRG